MTFSRDKILKDIPQIPRKYFVRRATNNTYSFFRKWLRKCAERHPVGKLTNAFFWWQKRAKRVFFFGASHGEKKSALKNWGLPKTVLPDLPDHHLHGGPGTSCPSLVSGWTGRERVRASQKSAPGGDFSDCFRRFVVTWNLKSGNLFSPDQSYKVPGMHTHENARSFSFSSWALFYHRTPSIHLQFKKYIYIYIYIY